MQDIKELNEYGNKPRLPGMPIPPDKVDQYLKETFGLSDEDLKELEKRRLVNGNNVDWGGFSSEHVYSSMFTGDGSTVEFSIYDSVYGDNSGSIKVDIYRIYKNICKLHLSR